MASDCCAILIVKSVFMSFIKFVKYTHCDTYPQRVVFLFLCNAL